MLNEEQKKKIPMLLKNIGMEVEVWEMKAGKITAVRIENAVFRAEDKKDEEIPTWVDEENKKSEECMVDAEIGIGSGYLTVKEALDKEAKPYKRRKRKRRIKGRRISDSVARDLSKTYGSPVLKERYLAVLKAIAVSNGATKDVIKGRTGLSVNAVIVHLLYGKRMHEIRQEGEVFFLRKNAETRIEKIKENLGIAKFKEAQNTVREDVEQDTQKEKSYEKKTQKTFKNGMTGTPITNKKALHIHMTYHVPILSEAFREILKIVNEPPNHQATAEEVARATGYSKNASMAHLRYGVNIGVLSTFMDKEGNQYFRSKSRRD
jgi:hypothetical protein